MASQSKFLKHWPTVLLGLVVGVILLIAVFSYQLNETETAVVTTLGKVEDFSPKSGLHFRWPYPFQDVIKFDNRLRCFEGNEAKVEETRIKDGANILVGIFVVYRINDARKFFETIETVAKAEEFLNSQMRSVKNAVFGRYRFDQLINANPKMVEFNAIKAEIKAELAQKAAPYGIVIEDAGINAFGQPSSITEAILSRMVEERKLEAQSYLSSGNTEAQKIRIQADTKSRDIITEAEAKAKAIRAEGDAEAAQYYAIFKENPELAIFLRKLESLRTIMKSRTTLVLDTDAAPFDLFKANSDKLMNTK